MRLAASEEIGAPAGAIYDRLADFRRIEAGARARGLDVERTEEAPARWRVGFDLAGARRTADLVVVGMDPPHGLLLHGEAAGIAARIEFLVDALGPDRSRLTLEARLRGTGLSGRMLLGTLGLGAAGIERRIGERLAAFGRGVEAGGGVG